MIQCESELANLESDEVVRSIGRGNTGEKVKLKNDLNLKTLFYFPTLSREPRCVAEMFWGCAPKTFLIELVAQTIFFKFSFLNGKKLFSDRLSTVFNVIDCRRKSPSAFDENETGIYLNDVAIKKNRNSSKLVTDMMYNLI